MQAIQIQKNPDPEQKHTDESAHLLSFCKATAESIRLDILRALKAESFGVMELCCIFGMPQPGISHHLKILNSAGLLETRREGNFIFYRRSLISADSSLANLQKSLYDAIDQLAINPAVQAKISEIHDERANSSRIFFKKNADKFKENQDLIAQYSQYAGCIQDLLSNEQLDKGAAVMEIGPGETDLLAFLSSRFGTVLALDNLEEMLNLAKVKNANSQGSNIQFHLGELKDLSTDIPKVELIVLNMVLHHLAAPSRIFDDAKKALGHPGTILVVDLCPHNQDWTRDICGDLWLGFDPQDLDTWAELSGYSKGQSVYLGLKNGFQIQMKLFHLT